MHVPEPRHFRFTVSNQTLDGGLLEALNRSQFATSSQKYRDPRFPPFAFTEHGADEAIAAILSAIRELANPPAPKRRGIGFTANIDEKP